MLQGAVTSSKRGWTNAAGESDWVRGKKRGDRALLGSVVRKPQIHPHWGAGKLVRKDDL